MKRTRKQHFIQERLLQNFSKNNNLWVYDKKAKKSFRSSPPNVGLRKDFLEPEADQLITKVEHECYPVIERIIKKECIVCRHFSDEEAEKNLFKLYRYIGCQITRTPKWREYLEKIKHLFSNRLDITDMQNELFVKNQIFPFINFNIPEVHDSKEDIGRIAKIYNKWITEHSKIGLKRFDEISAGLIDITIPFLVINESQTPFIINDAGVNWHYALEGISHDFGLRGTQMTSLLNFPIHPKYCISFCTIKSVTEWSKGIPRNSDLGFLIKTEENQQIILINKIIYYGAKRFTFYPSRRIARRAKDIYNLDLEIKSNKS